MTIKSIVSIEEMRQQYGRFHTQWHFNDKPETLYNPVRHILGIEGKRIRPLLTLACCDLFDGNFSDAMNAAFGIEVFHNFTLVHDDIMDKADLRRGKPTVHKKYGNNAAILSGDTMVFYALRHLSNVPVEQLHNVLSIFNKAAIEVIEGQQMDMDFEGMLDVTTSDYLTMIEYKTSVLLAASSKIGSLIGGADKQQQELMYNFGLKLGLAFQIMDDYLDAFGDEQKVGKRKGGDILLNKNTWLLTYALEKADVNTRKEIINLFDVKNEENKIAVMTDIFRMMKADVSAKSKANEFYKEAITILHSIEADEEKKNQLIGFAKLIYDRSY
jgi:geranylgeranyl diphosphate synthase type II